MTYGFNSNLEVKQTTKTALKNEAGIKAIDNSDSFPFASTLAFTTLVEGVPFYKYIKNNKKINGEMTEDMINLSNSTKNALKNLKNGNEKLTTRIAKLFDVVNQNNKTYSELRTVTKAKANLPKLEENLAKRMPKPGESFSFFKKWLFNRANNKVLKAKETIAKPIIPASIENAASKLKVGKILKSSGAPVLLAFGGIIEGITEIYPTFKELGAEKGMKQLGKSSVKVAGDALGFIAGQQTGMVIGSAIGSALFPGVGTAIGAITGLACGMIGSYCADKVTSKIVGKSELELAGINKNQNNTLNFAA